MRGIEKWRGFSTFSPVSLSQKCNICQPQFASCPIDHPSVISYSQTQKFEGTRNLKKVAIFSLTLKGAKSLTLQEKMASRPIASVIFFKFPTNWGCGLDAPARKEAGNQMPCHRQRLKIQLKKDAELENKRLGIRFLRP